MITVMYLPALAVRHHTCSRSRVRSPYATVERVSRILGRARNEASCRHGHRQEAQATRRRRTAATCASAPTGTCVRCRITVPQAALRTSQDPHNASDSVGISCERG